MHEIATIKIISFRQSGLNETKFRLDVLNYFIMHTTIYGVDVCMRANVRK